VPPSCARRTAALRAVEAIALLPDPSPLPWLAAIHDAPSLSLSEGLCLFATSMTLAAKAQRSWLSQDFHYMDDFMGFLRWLGGERAIIATRRALEDVHAIFDVIETSHERG
jgi:hypothetical protein